MWVRLLAEAGQRHCFKSPTSALRQTWQCLSKLQRYCFESPTSAPRQTWQCLSKLQRYCFESPTSALRQTWQCLSKLQRYCFESPTSALRQTWQCLSKFLQHPQSPLDKRRAGLFIASDVETQSPLQSSVMNVIVHKGSRRGST